MCRLIVLAAVLALLVACGGGSGGDAPVKAPPTNPTAAPEALSSDPGEAMLELFEYVRNGQWGREWEHLHAAHQSAASQDAFRNCAKPVSFDSSEVIEVFEERLTVAGIGPSDATAVTVELSANIGDTKPAQRFTLHLIEVDGAWRWILQDDVYAAYRAGDCP